MSLAIAYSRANLGIEAPLVTVETHLARGLPRFSIVGLPEAEVKESRDRVRSALLNANFDFPSSARITVNLAPADLPKEGGRFDLPIALAILAATRQIPSASLENYEFAGELALSGELHPIQGVFSFALACAKAKRQLIVPAENAEEAAMTEKVTVYPARHLLEVCAHLTNNTLLNPHYFTQKEEILTPYPDFSEVQGQHYPKRALEIAAAGGHSLLMIGTPGAGKTMLASRLTSILPDLTDEEALEVGAIASISGKKIPLSRWKKRPFRSPHHSASSVALVGGGSPPRPGEISLAHEGVLFLDELPEFNRHVLESLREPMELGTITISRAARQAEFPARFQFIAAMNPCPCGYFTDISGRCTCSSEQVQRYRARLSGPLLDRIDMHVNVLPFRFSTKTSHPKLSESSSAVRERVKAARCLQMEQRQKINARLNTNEIEKWCVLAEGNQDLLQAAVDKLGLSARAYHRILRLARTIADLAHQEFIQQDHLAEAIGYRVLDRP